VSKPPTDLLAATGLWSSSGGHGVPRGLMEVLAATRLLLGAWDTALHQWKSPAANALPTLSARAPAPISDAAELPTLALESDAPIACDPSAPLCLSVQVLDGLQIWFGSTAFPALPRGKARALLVYLLLNRRRPTPRSRLCSLFWPEADPESARNNLHVNLHRVRRLFKEAGQADCLHHDQDGYRLVPQGEMWLDAEYFGIHATQGEIADQTGDVPAAILHYEMAAALYRSDLVEDTEREPVLRALSQGLRDQLNLVLDRLSALREARGDLHACLRVAQRHLLLDECNESAHRRLMRGYARLGQPQLAEQQYRNCVRALSQRLGLPPTEETRALFREISERRCP
jgi:DNA-binding SARP family transcriptional activator